MKIGPHPLAMFAIGVFMTGAAVLFGNEMSLGLVISMSMIAGFSLGAGCIMVIADHIYEKYTY